MSLDSHGTEPFNQFDAAATFVCLTTTEVSVYSNSDNVVCKAWVFPLCVCVCVCVCVCHAGERG